MTTILWPLVALVAVVLAYLAARQALAQKGRFDDRLAALEAVNPKERTELLMRWQEEQDGKFVALTERMEKAEDALKVVDQRTNPELRRR